MINYKCMYVCVTELYPWAYLSVLSESANWVRFSVKRGFISSQFIPSPQFQLSYNGFKKGAEDVNGAAHPGRPSMSATDKNIEAVKKIISDNRRITIREVADHVGTLKHETSFSEDCSKITKYWAKITPHGHRLGDVDDFQQRYRFAENDHNWWHIMGVWLWYWN